MVTFISLNMFFKKAVQVAPWKLCFCRQFTDNMWIICFLVDFHWYKSAVCIICTFWHPVLMEKILYLSLQVQAVPYLSLKKLFSLFATEKPPLPYLPSTLTFIPSMPFSCVLLYCSIFPLLSWLIISMEISDIKGKISSKGRFLPKKFKSSKEIYVNELICKYKN